MIEALRRTGRELDTKRMVAAFEAIRGFDLGLGTPIAFSSNNSVCRARRRCIELMVAESPRWTPTSTVRPDAQH